MLIHDFKLLIKLINPTLITVNFDTKWALSGFCLRENFDRDFVGVNL